MRPGQQNNKNRSRGRGNNNGGRKHQNPLSRSYESNGPDVKIRGNAAHIAEKYQQLARDAHASGDSVMAENYLQHAEHYFRILSAAQPQGMMRPDFSNESDNDDDETEGLNGAGGDAADTRNDNDGNGRARRDDRSRRDEGQPRIERPAFVSEISGNGQAGPAADASQPDEQPAEAAAAEGDGADEPKRPRRPRRRRPSSADADTGQAGTQPADLPAFLTAGGTAAG